MGRSGPRKKTGCYTCRRRKVRCDETKPVCAHCTRLRLNCQYNKPTPIASDRYPESNSSYNNGNHRTSPSAAAIASTAASDGSCATPHSALPIDFNSDDMFNAILQQADQQCTTGGLHPHLSTTTAGIGSQYDQGLSVGFDISQFIGGITNELQQKQQGLQENIDAQMPVFPASSDGSGRDLQQQTNLAELMNDDVLGNSSSPMSAASSVRGHQERNRSIEPSSTWKSSSEEQLLQHFLSIESPPVLVAPLEAEWKFVRPAVLAMARDFHPLMNAIYCFSATHKSRLEGNSCQWASSYYRAASTGVSQHTTDDIDDENLRRVFATIFFLMMVEVSAQQKWVTSTTKSNCTHSIFSLSRS